MAKPIDESSTKCVQGREDTHYMDPVVCVATRRRLSLGMSAAACLVIAIVHMLSSAVKFHFIESKGLGVGVGVGQERVKLNTDDGHGHDSQAVDIDPLAGYYPFGVSSTLGNSSLPHISGLRVAFVGDSLTRYMYLSLAAYLRRGRWVDDTDVPNILEEKRFGDWNLFYNYTNNYFQPHEQCDCFRMQERMMSARAIENRYFKDPVRDNALYFINK
jgi:hypothetical protein